MDTDDSLKWPRRAITGMVGVASLPLAALVNGLWNRRKLADIGTRVAIGAVASFMINLGVGFVAVYDTLPDTVMEYGGVKVVHDYFSHDPINDLQDNGDDSGIELSWLEFYAGAFGTNIIPILLATHERVELDEYTSITVHTGGGTDDLKCTFYTPGHASPHKLTADMLEQPESVESYTVRHACDELLHEVF